MPDFYQHVIHLPRDHDVYAVHKAVYSNLMEEGETKRDFVFTPMDRPGVPHMPVLVRSRNPRAGWRQEQVRYGEIYDFLVSCYIKISDGRQKWAPQTPERRMQWLNAQAKYGGIALIDAYETSHRLYLRLPIRPGVVEHIFATTFTGRLQVTNEHRFTEELTTGFGKSPTYGLGMMLLTPVRRQ